MKILIVSLLRLGDIVLSAPVVRALKDKYPNAQVDLLINSQFSSVTNLIPGVHRVHLFERDLIQKGLGEADRPLFESFSRLENLVDELNANDYDQVINLTHNRLSGWLMGLISARAKVGLVFDPAGRASFGHGWFRFLNNQVEADGSETFHFTDVFGFGLGLDFESLRQPSLVETETGRREVDALTSNSADGIVVIQALTSDVKKDWGFSRWSRAIESLARANERARFVVIGAPSERDRLASLVSELVTRGVRAELAILGLEGAFSLLKRAKLLITGDTSIKHLAAAARTPIVEITLGSSDAYRTGAYVNGAIILQSRETCAPCVHSKPCHRASHLCAERLPTDGVAMVCNEVLNGRSFQLGTIAEEYRTELEILRVDMKSAGFWAAHSVTEKMTEASVARWIDLKSKQIWLSQEERRGSEILALASFLKKLHPTVSPIEWRHLFGDFEKQAAFVESRINGLKVGVQYLKGTYEDPRKMREFIKGVIGFRERIKSMPLMKSFSSSLDQIIEDDISPAFTKFRRIVEAVSEMERRTSIHLGLVRGLTEEMETKTIYDQGAERA